MRHILLTLLLSGLLLTSGCANKRLANQDQFDQLASEKAEQFAGDSEKALLEAEVKHEEAVNADMYFFAPLHMEQATEALNLARNHELKGLQSDSLIASSKVLTLLQLAQENKLKVKSQLVALLTQKKLLEDLNCPQVLPSEFDDQLEAIGELVKKIESGEAVKTEAVQTVLTNMQELELETLLVIHWQPAKKTLDKAKDENADDNAPKSFILAEELVAQAEIEIRNNYRNREMVEKKGLKALRSAQHALYLARDAELLVQLDNQGAEKAALIFENLLATIGTALKAGDVSHMALIDQANALAQSAETQASRLIAPLQIQITKLEKQLALATQVVEEPAKVEAVPKVEETPTIEETSVVEEIPKVEETPSIEKAPVTEKTE